jgi:hypothetical protein
MPIDNQHVCLPLKVEISVANMVCVGGLAGKKKWKFLKFVVIFWFLKLGQPIVHFKSMKMLFDFLKVKNMLCKH